MLSVKYCLEGLADLALPRACVVCGRELSLGEKHICIFCAADIPFTYFWMLEHNEMADRFNALIARDMFNSDQKPTYEKYSRAVALFYYHGDAGYKRIPQSLKYYKRIDVGRYFSAMLAERMFSMDLFMDVDMIVPVPLHWYRQWERGYNQAEVIARCLSSVCGAVVQTGLMTRNRHTTTQTRLRMENKEKNVSGAFSINERVGEKYSPEHILLVDDVFTTGATLNACHHPLRKFYGPATRISVATLGFVSYG